MPVEATAYTKRPSKRLSRVSTAAQAEVGSIAFVSMTQKYRGGAPATTRSLLSKWKTQAAQMWSRERPSRLLTYNAWSARSVTSESVLPCSG